MNKPLFQEDHASQVPTFELPQKGIKNASERQILKF